MKHNKKQFILVTDDITGAADSGAYFLNRGIDIRIYTGNKYLETNIPNDCNVALNLSTRNSNPKTAFDRHFNIFSKINFSKENIVMKKIGTGFRGMDQYEINGIMHSNPNIICFLIDSAPDLGTFTLYGNQYCEGCILTKSIYSKDPIITAKESNIVNILKNDIDFNISHIDIDTVKNNDANVLIEETNNKIKNKSRIIVFDSITKNDVKKIVSVLEPLYDNVVWIGSLGIAEALSDYISDNINEAHNNTNISDDRCVCFTASSYETSKQQIEYSCSRGLKKIELDIDYLIDNKNNTDIVSNILEETSNDYINKAKNSNVMLMPKVSKYSFKENTSEFILKTISKCAGMICPKLDFDRIAIIGGETAQAILDELDINIIDLSKSLEVGSASGIIMNGKYKGKTLSLKGGSIGSIKALELMMGR